MLKAILFDLDDTLLGNSMSTFMPAYFELITDHMQSLMPKEQFVRGLLAGTRAIIANAAPSLTNAEKFWQTFERNEGIKLAEFQTAIDEFYATRFEELEGVTQKRPEAVEAVQFCLEKGLQVVVATNPLFPNGAIESRLRWAGLPVDEYSFSLVTSMDNMHAAKPSRAYYHEIIETIGVKPKEAMMVGDSWDNDIMPTNKLKLWTFWVAPDDMAAPVPLQATSRGTMEKFLTCCRSGWLDSYA